MAETALARRPRPPRLTPKGEWNNVTVVLGVPGTGKSTFAVLKALELGRTPAYLLAHDPAWRLPDKLPDGRRVPIHRHESVKAGRAALARDASGIHSIACVDGGDVLQLGRELGRASLKAGGGERGVPVVVVLDEVVGTKGASPYRLGDELREALTLRRHLHMGLIINTQSPQMAHYALLGQATELVCFRMVDERALRELQKVGVSSSLTRQIRALPNHRFIRHKL